MDGREAGPRVVLAPADPGRGREARAPTALGVDDLADELRVEGIKTTAPFHKQVLSHTTFAEGLEGLLKSTGKLWAGSSRRSKTAVSSRPIWVSW